jgi:uncharacterized caspase-like protein
MKARWLVAHLVVLFLLAVPSLCSAATRVALLIGNSTYRETAPLANPANDVTLLKEALDRAGFDTVEAANDLDRSAMVKTLRTFETKANGSDIALVYYSGHGMEMRGTNYLLPIDATLATDLDVEDEAVTLDRVERAVSGAKRLRLIILDACRNNPFESSMARSGATRAVTRGLSRVEPDSADTLVAFAAKAGTLASDGEGSNSPFAKALVSHLFTPGVDVRIALGQIRDAVLAETGRKQEPFVYGSLGGAPVMLGRSARARSPTSDCRTPTCCCIAAHRHVSSC